MHDFVPADADLVLVEFSVNDWEVVDAQNFAWMDNSLRQAIYHGLHMPARTFNLFLPFQHSDVSGSSCHVKGGLTESATSLQARV